MTLASLVPLINWTTELCFIFCKKNSSTVILIASSMTAKKKLSIRIIIIGKKYSKGNHKRNSDSRDVTSAKLFLINDARNTMKFNNM